MLNTILCVTCWVVSSMAVLPLTWMCWLETTNTCSGQDPVMFFWAIGNLCWAFAYGHQLFQARPLRRMVRFWTVSTIYYFLPFVLLLALGGLSGLTSAYDGFSRYFTRDLSQDPAGLAFKMYGLIWLPLAGTLSLGFALYAASERTLGLPEPPGFTRDHWKYHWVFPALAVTVGSISARHDIWWNAFERLEHRSANNIARAMKFHSLMNTNIAITNLTQLSASTNPEFLTYLHEAFAQYGRYAGFERSIQEKYAFVSPPFTNRMGQVVLVSSIPYPDREGKEERILILRTGTSDDYDYYARPQKEDMVKGIFSEAGRSLPSRPRPSALKVKGAPIHVRMAEVIGLGPQWALEFSLALFTAGVFGLWKVLTLVDRLLPWASRYLNASPKVEN